MFLFKYFLIIFMSPVARKIASAHVAQIQGTNCTLNVRKRAADTTFHGHPKTHEEILARKFGIEAASDFGQSDSLVNLLNKIALEYLSNCPPFIYYDTFVDKSNSFLLQKLFKTFPISFYQAKINARDIRHPLQHSDENCRSYILFLSQPGYARKILGPQTTSKVVIVARSSQYLLRQFLSSRESSDLINLLVIGESLMNDRNKEQPYVLYTHHLYADGLGSNTPIVLTSWIKNALSRPHVNLFPPKLAHGFSGHRFSISAVNQPPFIFRKQSIDYSGSFSVQWDGIEYRLMELIAKRLNFSFEIQEPTNSKSLGTSEAVIQAVQFGNADVGMSGVYITVERLLAVDMSIGHSRDCATFVTLSSKALPKYRAIMGPFQWPVWVALIAAYLGAIVPLAFTDRLSLRHLIGNYSEMQNMFWYVFGTFTNSLTFTGQYSWSNSEKTSTRLLIGFYWVFTIIITACYTGSIIAFVTLPAFPDTVDSVYDLLGLFYRVGTLDKGGWQLWFQNSTHVPTAKLYNKIEFVSDIYEGIGNVTKSFFWKYAFLGSGLQLEYLIQSNFSAEIGKRSALHLSKDCFAPFYVAYAFPKNSVYTERINMLILLAQESGLLSKISNEVSWAIQRSSTGNLLRASSGHALREVLQEERQLTTADTEGMFLLMGLGYFLAAVAFISEMVGGITNRCRKLAHRPKHSSRSCRTSSIGSKEDHSRTQSFRSHFLTVNKLELSKATIKELFSGGRKSEPIIVMQAGRLIFENDAKSTESSVCDFNPKTPRTELDGDDILIHQTLDLLDDCIEESDDDLAVDIDTKLERNCDDLFGSYVEHVAVRDRILLLDGEGNNE